MLTPDHRDRDLVPFNRAGRVTPAGPAFVSRDTDMPQTPQQISAMFATALAQFPCAALTVPGGVAWKATMASAAFNTEFGQGGGFDTYDLTLTATKPAGAADLKTSMRVIWNNQPYNVARVENVQDGALYVVGLNRGSVPRG